MTRFSTSGSRRPGTVEVLRLIGEAARETYPGVSPTFLRRRFFFVFRALRYRALLSTFYTRLANVLPDGISASSDLVGVTEWPYLNNAWDVAERLDRIATHYELLASSSKTLLTMDRRSAFPLLDLSRFSSGCTIVIDRAHWFKREGELVLNLFREDLRVASTVFMLGVHGGAPAILIGATQGIHKGIPSDESLQIFRDLTKDFEGLRPRSLLLEILRMIANVLQIKILLAVADENRHHRHRYFGAVGVSKLTTNYNEIWTEHGGSPSTVPGFYALPVHPQRKELADVPAKKRALYKRRYAMLAEIEKGLAGKIN
jgi:uncharacterized protein VirK/YbjX